MTTDAKFWDGIAEKVRRSAGEGYRRLWIPYGALVTLPRWFGKAPLLYNYGRATPLRELREVGFVEIEERDVGAAESTVAFVVAKKPG